MTSDTAPDPEPLSPAQKREPHRLAAHAAIGAGRLDEGLDAWREVVRGCEPGLTFALGDSHVNTFGSCHGLIPIWLGSITAHRSADAERGQMLWPDALNIPADADLVFCFGEIDCRNHVVRAASDTQVAISAAAEKLADDYVDTIVTLTRDRSGKVFLATPPAPSEISEESPSFVHLPPNPPTITERIEASAAFSRRIRDQARQADFEIFDLFGLSATGPDELMRPEFNSDGIHMMSEAGISATAEEWDRLRAGKSLND